LTPNQPLARTSNHNIEAIMFRAVAILSLLFSTLPTTLAQFNNQQNNEAAGQSPCGTGGCGAGNTLASAPSLPSHPATGKWQTEDFRPTDASVSCAVVKYDSTVSRPVLHLLCPGPDVFAPLRVHLSLTWKNENEMPAIMRSLPVDISRSVNFKSRPGVSRVELRFQDPQARRSIKEWITFTEVNVGLVVPPK
jgi:hypothetical protein